MTTDQDVNCLNCKYSLITTPDPNNLGHQVRECHRYPPSTQLITTNQGMMNMSQFSTVRDSDYCGEFKLKQESYMKVVK